MFSGFVQLAFGLWKWAGNVLTAIGDWLRDDHDWWRIGCLLAALSCLLIGFVAHDRQRTIVLVRTQCSAAQQQCSIDKKTLAEQASLQARALERVEQLAKEREAELARLRRINVSLAAENTALKAAAVTARDEYLERYKQRPRTCSDAIAAMAAACPTLEGY